MYKYIITLYKYIVKLWKYIITLYKYIVKLWKYMDTLWQNAQSVGGNGLAHQDQPCLQLFWDAFQICVQMCFRGAQLVPDCFGMFQICCGGHMAALGQALSYITDEILEKI